MRDTPTNTHDHGPNPRTDRVMLTLPLIIAGVSRNGYWSDVQLACLGLYKPLGRGWKRRLIGKYISRATYDRFVVLTNAHLEASDYEEPDCYYHGACVLDGEDGNPPLRQL
jgi:hypothetical protein